ncbi:MAG: MBOAT family O-acyltransferase, partial [Bdellovibrionota bacterium]
SGYSDIAIGSAGFLRIEVPNNFNLPFFADSIVNFWRRWHMTLNWWTNQYVFRPLVYSDALAVLRRLPGVGEKIFQHREYIAVLLAMSVIGIWHGLTINYLLWGAYMGALICFELRWASGFQRQCPRPLRIFLTFFLVLNGFVIFLSSSPANAARMWTKMYSSQVFMALAWPPRHVGLCGIVLAVPHLIDAVLIKAGHFEKRPWIALATCVVFFSLHFFMDGFYGAIFEYSKF